MRKLGLIVALVVLGWSSAWAFGGPWGGMQGGYGCGMNLVSHPNEFDGHSEGAASAQA
jgi:hypothetical protein